MRLPPLVCGFWSRIDGSFGPNPTNLTMFVWRPAVTPIPAAIIVLSYCPPSAQAAFSATKYASLADKYGFTVIYPAVKSGLPCWNYSLSANLFHDQGGDTLGIASMIRYAIANYAVIPTKVYVTGVSMGGYMAALMAGAYRS